MVKRIHCRQVYLMLCVGVVIHCGQVYDLYADDTLSSTNEEESILHGYTERASAYANKGDISEAIRMYHEYLKLSPHSAGVLRSLGALYRANAQYEYAIKYYKQSLEIEPQDVPTIEVIVSCYLEQGKQNEATEFVTAMYDEIAHPRKKQALIRYLKGCNITIHDTRVKDYVREYAEHKGHDPMMLVSYAHVLEEEGQYEKAEEILKKVLETAPQESDYWCALGALYEKMNKYEESIHAYEKAHEYHNGKKTEYIKVSLERICMIRQLDIALKAVMDQRYSFALQSINEAQKYARIHKILYREMEDGFYKIRSVLRERLDRPHNEGVQDALKKLLQMEKGFNGAVQRNTLIFYALLICFIVCGTYVNTRLVERTEPNATESCRGKRIERAMSVVALLSALVVLVVHRLFLWWVANASGEILNHGVFARDVIEGVRSSLFDYRFVPYHGGSILYGLLAVPAFMIWGDSFLSLYGVSLIFPVGVVLFVWFLGVRYFNRSVALIAIFFYITLPMQCLMQSVSTIGIHAEASFFSVLIFFLFYTFLFNERLNSVYWGNVSSRNAYGYALTASFLCGFISGIAPYFYIYSILVVVYFFCMWGLYDPFFWKKRLWYVACAGFIVGFSPVLIAYLHGQNLFVVTIRSASGEHPFWMMLFRKSWQEMLFTAQLLWYGYKVIFMLPQIELFSLFTIPRGIYASIVVLAILYGMVMFVKGVRPLIFFGIHREDLNYGWKVKGFRVALMGGFVALGAGFSVLHPMVWPFEPYNESLYPIVGLLIGCFIMKVERAYIGNISLRFLATMITVVVVVCGFIHFKQGELYYDRKFEEAKTHKGFSIEVAHGIYRRNIFSDFLRFDLFMSVGAWKERPYQELARHNYLRASGRYRSSIYKDYGALKEMSEIYRAQTLFLIGLSIGDGLDSKRLSYSLRQLPQLVPSDYLPYIHEGIALSITNRTFNEVRMLYETGEIKKVVPEEYQHYYFLEYGRRIAENNRLRMQERDSLLSHCPEKFYPYAVLGFMSLVCERIEGERISYQHKDIASIYFERLGIERLSNVRDLRKLDEHTDVAERVRDYIRGYGYMQYMNQLSSTMIGENDDTFKERRVMALRDVMQEVPMLDCNETEIGDLYRGYGLGFSLSTWGQWSLYDHAVLKEIIPDRFFSAVCEGYGMGIARRYGYDTQCRQRIVDQYCPSEIQASVRRGLVLSFSQYPSVSSGNEAE